MSRRKLSVPSIVLDRRSELPLHRQIVRQIATAIQGGEIPGGARLPASRVLAGLLRVSRNTVLTAYDELAAEGLIQGERGAGMRVERPAQVPGMTMSTLRQVMRASGYPESAVVMTDPDGNPFYLHS